MDGRKYYAREMIQIKKGDAVVGETYDYVEVPRSKVLTGNSVPIEESFLVGNSIKKMRSRIEELEKLQEKDHEMIGSVNKYNRDTGEKVYLLSKEIEKLKEYILALVKVSTEDRQRKFELEKKKIDDDYNCPF